MQKVIDKTTVLVYNIIVVMSEDIAGYMQTYRSGHIGADSKSPSANGSKTSEKPLTVRISGIRPPQAHREF